MPESNWMDKKTTAQVAKTLGITLNHLHKILHDYPALRPVECVGTVRRYLWSEAEIEAFMTHLTQRRRRFTRRS
jgi:hypothetical protein